MTSSKRLRIGVIGCGTVAQIMHLPYLYTLPEHFELAALSDLSPQLVQAMGAKYQVPREHHYTDYQQMLQTEIDAVLVCTSGSHAPQVLAAIAANKHVLVEKPLCFTLREADEILVAAAKHNVKVMVAYMKRYDPGYCYAQTVVKEMAGIRYIQINTLHPSEDQYWHIHSLQRFNDVAPEVIGPLLQAQEALLDEAIGKVADSLRFVYYDVILGSMVHDINALRGLIGEPEEVLYTHLWPEGDRTPSITTLLRYAGDTRVLFTWTYLAELRDYFEEIALMSSAMRLRIQFPSPFLKHFPTPIVVQQMENGVAVEKRVQASYDEAFRQELIAFHDCIVEDRQPLTGISDGRTDIAILQQILAALEPEGLGGEAARSLRV
jgi:predicted dehydrogenase